MKTMKRISIAVFVALAIAGCTRDDEALSMVAGPSGRNFIVNMTDGPANFQRLDIEITGVEAYHDSRGWVRLNTTVRSLNILELSNGVSKTIATSSNVETGHYSRLRLHFGGHNTVTLHAPVAIGATPIPANTPSELEWVGSERFVDIPIDAQISDRMGTQLMLDFDAAASVYEGMHTYVLKPEINVMGDLMTGARGKVTGTRSSAFIVISNERYSYSAYANADGQFLIRGMAEGIYHATISGMVWNDMGRLEERQITRDNIKVTKGTFTPIRPIQF